MTPIVVLIRLAVIIGLRLYAKQTEWYPGKPGAIHPFQTRPREEPVLPVGERGRWNDAPLPPTWE